MLGFWVKAFVAAAIVVLVVYGTTRLRKQKSGCLTLFLILFAILISPILWFTAYYNMPIYYLEPFKGKVVERGTGNPIPDAVVVVEYYENWHGFETTSHYISTREALTDKNGEYHIPSVWQIRRGGTPYGELTIFKPGYSFDEWSILNYLDTMFWNNYDHRFWNTEYQVFMLKKLLTMDERRENYYDIETIGWAPYYSFLLNEESIYLGLSKRKTSDPLNPKTVDLPFLSASALHNTPLSDIIMLSTTAYLRSAIVQDVRTGQEWEIWIGDVIGIEKAEVLAIELNTIRIRIGTKLTNIGKKSQEYGESQSN